ncbi:MAG: hypothetical protein KJ592_00215 [Nanoarchaeota archaeon]|nr:hypothetical protein [Nanoarchaeota archaeon]
MECRKVVAIVLGVVGLVVMFFFSSPEENFFYYLDFVVAVVVLRFGRIRGFCFKSSNN